MSQVILLGAGASKEAGVPTTTEMTEAMVKAIADGYESDLASALNFVCGAMIAHDTARGASPFDSLDIERVFSAVQLLADREELEVTPFVAAWHPAVDAVGERRGRFPGFWGRDFSRALLDSSSNFGLERVFADGVRAVLGTKSNDVYPRLMRELTQALRHLVDISDPGALLYLSPILDLAGEEDVVTVATLNYDLTIETAGRQAGVRVDTGIEEWSQSGTWPDVHAGVCLLKLHGSVDWVWKPVPHRDGYLAERIIEVSSDPLNERAEPAVVFGQRGKLRAEGPFLELLQQFEVALDRVDELVSVGYSFRDEHVNQILHRWINKSGENRLTVIDPAFPERDERDTFRGSLVGALVSPDWGRPRFATRLEIIRKPASVGLPEVLSRLS